MARQSAFDDERAPVMRASVSADYDMVRAL